MKMRRMNWPMVVKRGILFKEDILSLGSLGSRLSFSILHRLRGSRNRHWGTVLISCSLFLTWGFGPSFKFFSAFLYFHFLLLLSMFFVVFLRHKLFRIKPTNLKQYCMVIFNLYNCMNTPRSRYWTYPSPSFPVNTLFSSSWPTLQ